MASDEKEWYPYTRYFEAMTWYDKNPFSGELDERAYLLGLRAGDLYVRKHGRSVKITVSTTHPAMIEPMQEVFGKYARVVLTPKFIRKWKQLKWEVYSLLHPSFEFFLTKTIGTNESFLSFFAGFFDAEGSISIRRQSRSTTTRIVMEVSSNDLGLLTFFDDQLRKLGYNPCFPSKLAHMVGDVVGYGPYTQNFWRLYVNRTKEAVKLLSSLPIKHREKMLKRELAIQYHSKPWKDVSLRVRALRQRIREEVRMCVKEAKRTYLTRHKITQIPK